MTSYTNIVDFFYSDVSLCWQSYVVVFRLGINDDQYLSHTLQPNTHYRLQNSYTVKAQSVAVMLFHICNKSISEHLV